MTDNSPIQPKGDHIVRLFLGGDVMTGRAIDQLFAVHNPDDFGKPGHWPARRYEAWSEGLHGPAARPQPPAYIWGDALDYLAQMQPDFSMVNLETAITTSGEWEAKGFNYRMHPDNTACLAAAGIDCVTLANNHVLDFGTQGLLDTLGALATAGIGTCGAGEDHAQAMRPHIHQLADGHCILVFAWALQDSAEPMSHWAATSGAPGINYLERITPSAARAMKRAIDNWRQPGDLVIVSLHWGANWVREIPQAHRWLARYLIESAGVDLIHGHSAHHVLPVEIHRGKLVLYGCGDLINDMEARPDFRARRGHLGALYLVDFDMRDRRLAALHVQPVERRRFRLEPASAQDAAWVRAQMHDLGRADRAARNQPRQ